RDDQTDGAADDGVSGRHRRWAHHRHVPAHLRDGRQHQDRLMPGPGGGGEALVSSKRRLTYLMLFRVGVVSLLLVVALLAELAAPDNSPTSPLVKTLLGLIAATYGLTIAYALGIERVRTERLAAAQVVMDLLLATALVHLTGGAESGFV